MFISSWRLLGIGYIGSQNDRISQVYVSDVFLRFAGIQEKQYPDASAHGTRTIDFDGVDQRYKSPTEPFPRGDSRKFGV
jgi:hypothetical protein